jgi:hypothetical protein
LPTNASPAANTGAFQVWGGTSISANAYIGGATLLNGSGTAGYDTIVKGVNDSTLVWARPNSAYDQVIIGNSATASTVVTGAKLQINSTDSMMLPVGTQSQRPGSGGYGTATAGMLRYSTTTNGIEWFNGTSWTSAGGVITVIADQQFNGDGATVNFTLNSSQTTASCIVSINGVIQIPTLAYSVSGTVLTFTEPPIAGDVIDIRSIATTNTVTQIYDTSTYNTVTVSGTGVLITTGTTAAANVVQWTTTGAQVNLNANIYSNTASTVSGLDSFYANTYSSAEYTVTATINGTNIKQIAKALVVSDGVNAYVTTYGITTTTGNTLATFSGNVTGGTVNFNVTPTNNTTIFRVRKEYQAI